jgi:membrane protease YdiL (CAAX protease family)
MKRYLVTVVGLTWLIQVTFLLLGWNLLPAKLAELAILLGFAVLFTAREAGRRGVRDLFAGAVRWRIGIGRYLLVLAAVPALTLAIAAATGTLRDPAGGWPRMIVEYLLAAVLLGALLGNLWEETAWGGYVQTRLMDRHGLLVGSLLTAIPFALIHLPLAYEEHGLRGTSLGSAALTWALLIATAPFARYLIGMLLVDTGGSVLAAALVHASWNASGSLAAVDGGWQYIPALIVLTVSLAGYRAARGRAPAVALR